MTSSRRLSLVAGVSLAYDLTAGVLLFFFTSSMAGWFGSAVPDPVLFAKLNGLFLMAVGLGYAPALGRPESHRAYLWIFGPLLKGAGAVTFITNYFQHGSPPAFLLFAATDGILAAATLAALLARPQVQDGRHDEYEVKARRSVPGGVRVHRTVDAGERGRRVAAGSRRGLSIRVRAAGGSR